MLPLFAYLSVSVVTRTLTECGEIYSRIGRVADVRARPSLKTYPKDLRLMARAPIATNPTNIRGTLPGSGTATNTRPLLPAS